MNKIKQLSTPTHQATSIMFVVNKKTRNIVNSWYRIATNYHMIDDSPSLHKNLNCFIEHRHDQSIFSLLTKKYNIYSKKTLSDCIELSRNKTGISRLKF